MLVRRLSNICPKSAGHLLTSVGCPSDIGLLDVHHTSDGRPSDICQKSDRRPSDVWQTPGPTLFSCPTASYVAYPANPRHPGRFSDVPKHSGLDLFRFFINLDASQSGSRTPRSVSEASRIDFGVSEASRQTGSPTPSPKGSSGIRRTLPQITAFWF